MKFKLPYDKITGYLRTINFFLGSNTISVRCMSSVFHKVYRWHFPCAVERFANTWNLGYSGFCVSEIIQIGWGRYRKKISESRSSYRTPTSQGRRTVDIVVYGDRWCLCIASRWFFIEMPIRDIVWNQTRSPYVRVSPPTHIRANWSTRLDQNPRDSYIAAVHGGGGRVSHG